MSLYTQPDTTQASPSVAPVSGAPVSGAPTSRPPDGATPPAQAGRQRRYTVIFGVVAAVVTVAALLLAAASSALQPPSANGLPASWQRVYSHDLTTGDDGAWDETQGCSITGAGLDAGGQASAGGQCAFQPSLKQNVTGAGFYFEAQLAPAAKTPNYVRSFITVGDLGHTPANGASLHFVISQQGSYVLCDGSCTRGASAIYQSGSAVAWHGNAYVANTVAIKVSPDHALATVYLNNQELVSAPVQLGAEPGLSVGAFSGDEAIFTQASLYTGQ